MRAGVGVVRCSVGWQAIQNDVSRRRRLLNRDSRPDDLSGESILASSQAQRSAILEVASAAFGDD